MNVMKKNLSLCLCWMALSNFGAVVLEAEQADEPEAPLPEAEQAAEALPQEAPILAQIRDTLENSDQVEDPVKAFAIENLFLYCTNETFAAEAQAQNDLKTPLKEIQRIDAEWTNAEEELSIHREKLNNACANELKRIATGNAAIAEVFVMDDQGAIVGANNLTSDYWQGDEAKWKNSFNEGKGGIDIGKQKFDRSAYTVLQQISLPIMDAQGQVIGAVTFGIAVDKI